LFGEKGVFTVGKTARIIVLILLVVLLSGVVLGMLWFKDHYIFVDKTFYPMDLEVLDLRQEEVSVSRYRKLQRNLPECRILWNVPFQGHYYSNDITELTVSSLTAEDAQQLLFFENLQVLKAEGCTDYSQLMLTAKTYPNISVRYQVTLDGQPYDQDTDFLPLGNITQEEVALLDVLPELKGVTLSGAGNIQDALALQSYCREKGLTFGIVLGTETYTEDVQQISVTNITEAQMDLLKLMPSLKKIHLQDPVASAQRVLELEKNRSDLTVTWSKNICGKEYDHTAVEVDLSDAQITDISQVEEGMAYLPHAKNLFLGLCGLDNEEIAAYRERSRDKYKVVWVVDLSGKMQVRTDIDNFMPSRDGWGYVRDGEVNNIRYCEELICIDLGHMGIRDVSFLETLVNLEYLILAHTEVQYIDPIVNCKKLKYLELDWSTVRDVSPLVELTALEDLNLGMTWPDIKPILQMTWLKNLYIIKGNTRANFAEALPNTRVVATGEYTVSNGWRNLPNYYAMRDILGMYYM
jgi:hypothetical protein